VNFGPWAPDQPYRDGVCIDVVDALSYAEKYRALPTISEVSVSAVSGDVRGAFASRLIAGVSKTYVGTESAIYERNGAGWTDVSGATYTLAAGDRWEMTQFGSDLYAVSLSEVMQKQTAGTGSFTNAAGSITAACISNVRRFVVVGDVDEGGTLYPHKVRWCAIGDPDDWTASEATQAGSQELDARDGRVMGIRGGEFGVVLQQHAITRMVYVGAPIVWQFDKIDDRNGCEVPGSIVQAGREIYFLSHDGWRVTNGSGESVNIGDGVINKWFRANLDQSNKSKISGAYNPDWRAVVWSFPSATGNGENDSILVYSITDKRWTRGSYGVQKFFEGATASTTLEGLDAYFSSIDDVTPSLDDPFWIGGEYKFLGMNGGLLVTIDNTPGTAYIETNDSQPVEGGMTRVLGIEPVIDATTTVQVGYRNLPTESVSYTPVQSVNSRTGQANFQIAARWLRAKFAISGSFYDAVGFNVIAKPAGK